MKYIKPEQFLKADKKIQEAIIEWWKPETGDLVESNGEYCVIDTLVNAINCSSINLYNDGNNTFGKAECIPLLTEGQLREFIEDKTGSSIETFFDIYNKYCFNLVDIMNFETIETGERDLLQALWKVVCKIAK
ncbi:hypothetical protein G8V07_12535 [Clostridium botulinum D/C]|uniref:hypothetical protein n=1 Tax=Clostridium botulinum TaxID=1491 RepID=UPI001E3A425B|nr:hypothetical protein [Clostridium botulinum]MCD3321136.1 hypothetical protein [Clostridium botulinum D/C]MCD3324576.1 hypothetical protein [Clostridium botulinum D/C]MCD3326858.1 hypothetical protein [Clostridium botulinum D/C]